jgi:hypothetical protein
MTGGTNLKEVLSLVDKVALKHFQIPLHVHGHVRAGRRAPPPALPLKQPQTMVLLEECFTVVTMLLYFCL